jgi:hypothetical protein
MSASPVFEVFQFSEVAEFLTVSVAAAGNVPIDVEIGGQALPALSH